jgi:hypothetical protein
MILIGTMNITRTCDDGDFYCPTCGSVRQYKLKSRRPFLTIYLIPTVPIGGVEYFVRCLQCKSHWDPAILNGTEQTHREQQEHHDGNDRADDHRGREEPDGSVIFR